ncbi:MULTISPECIES: Na+/H+ antiporter subunit E [unclassified Saccharicrinis]|uniref:Na+/H+ antiporter subunit E n=1 Tax=unclassified Saccharicrinis TaxID=2646859 RepID=UPI003D347AA5
MKYIVLFIFSLGFWLLLTFSLSLQNIMVGVVAALLTVLFFGNFFPEKTARLLQPQRYLWFIVYLFIFIWECLKANFDVAYRVLHPAMPIKPGIVKIEMSLKTDLARTILANSITMTPGTITVDMIGDLLYVHWIYISSTDPEVYSKKIAGRFEKYIKKIFE